jgi:hypothetical protein
MLLITPALMICCQDPFQCNMWYIYNPLSCYNLKAFTAQACGIYYIIPPMHFMCKNKKVKTIPYMHYFLLF